MPLARLLDVMHSEKKLYLVFEFLSQDLKKYMDSTPAPELPPHLVKVPRERRGKIGSRPLSQPTSAGLTPPHACHFRATSSSCCRG